jgi:hypothetical protein
MGMTSCTWPGASKLDATNYTTFEASPLPLITNFGCGSNKASIPPVRRVTEGCPWQGLVSRERLRQLLYTDIAPDSR